VMLTQSPESSLLCRPQIGCLSLLTSGTVFDSVLEISTGASEDALLSSDGFLFRTPFWKARTDSSLLIEKKKNKQRFLKAYCSEGAMNVF
jgi:hypothetical protein